MKKKTLWIILMISALFSMAITKIKLVQASPTTLFMDPPLIRDPTMGPITQFTINITVDYIDPDWDAKLWGYQFTLRFNPDVLHGVSVENGPFMSSAGGRVLVAPGTGFNNTEGTLGLFGAALYPKVNFPTGGGILANVTFEVAGYGVSPIRFDVNTGLSNQTGGWEFNGETLRYPPNPDFLQHSYFDNSQLYVNPSRVRGVPNDESFTVNISLNGIEDLYSWSLYLNWSAPLLNVTSITEGDFLKSEHTTSFYSETHNDEGYVYINNTITEPPPGVDGSGTFATLTFLATGNGNTTLLLYDISLLNSTGGTISILTSDGWFDNELHTLTIDTQTVDVEPLPGITFTLDGILPTTPFSDSLEDREYTGVMPSKAQIGGARYDFVNWTDGTTEAERIIDLTMDMSLTANYKLGALLIHNIDTGLNYSSIQEAIDDVETLDGHTIKVDAGIFYESVILSKSLKLVGEDPYTTIIDGNGVAEDTILVAADNVVISGFTLRNSTDDGIWVDGSQNTTITGNIITTLEGAGFGILLEGSTDKNTISNNILVTNDVGIYLGYSNNNTITGNNITFTSTYGLQLENSANNTLIGNTISNNAFGLYLYEFSHSTLIDNTISDNTYGIYLAYNTHNLTIYHNNFIDNTPQVYIESASLNNTWDNDYPSGGNYWSNYIGVDEMSGAGQDELGSDGIGDTSHEIDADNIDNYPLMSQWRGHVIIDETVVNDNRVNVGSEQTVAFHAKWSLDGTNVTSGTIYVNGTGYSVNAMGWISFNIAYDIVGKRLWTVTGVLCNYITTYEYLVEDPYIIWDRVNITLSVVDNRINVADTATITATAVYEYDDATFSGTITYNSTIYTYDTVGKQGYTVASILDPTEDITAFESNSVYCIWDRIKIAEGGVTNTQTNITQTETVWFRAVYEYDNMNFDDSSGTLYVNGSLMTWGTSYNRWEHEYIFHTPSARAFQISAVSDALYGLSVINDVVGPLTITWNDFQIVFDGTTYAIPITTSSNVSDIAFDPDARQLSFSVDGSTGTVGFCNVSIPKTFMWGDWVVTVDGVPVDYDIAEDDDYTYIYFTYIHSTHNVKMVSTDVVPELPTPTSILTVLIALAAAIMALRKLRTKRSPSVR